MIVSLAHPWMGYFFLLFSYVCRARWARDMILYQILFSYPAYNGFAKLKKKLEWAVDNKKMP